MTKKSNGRRIKTGAPEVDALLRKVQRQGGRVERAGHGLQMWGPQGQGPEFITGSRPRRGAVRAIRSSLRRIGIEP